MAGVSPVVTRETIMAGRRVLAVKVKGVVTEGSTGGQWEDVGISSGKMEGLLQSFD